VIAANIATDLVLTLGVSSIIDSADGADNKYDSAVNITLLPLNEGQLAAGSTGVVPASAVKPSEKLSLGVTGSTVSRNDTGSASYLNDPYGVWIDSVAPNSPAERAGLKRGDIIRSFNGHRVSTFEELNAYVNEASPGRPVDLGVFRNREVI